MFLFSEEVHHLVHGWEISFWSLNHNGMIYVNLCSVLHTISSTEGLPNQSLAPDWDATSGTQNYPVKIPYMHNRNIFTGCQLMNTINYRTHLHNFLCGFTYHLRRLFHRSTQCSSIGRKASETAHTIAFIWPSDIEHSSSVCIQVRSLPI